YQSILNQVGSPLPQPTTQYLSVWHQIAVPIVAQFQNGRVHSGGVLVPFETHLVFRIAFLNYIDPSPQGLNIIDAASNETINWWHSSDQF
ncbi:unnamed protein product, partial [Didymodactylos carnosus]